ncbi:hypothetical protein Moror_1689 [Moniliophthora roreri MCA 2997]|uniref:Uncharacterized protein n=1 Tax=Moniliophthora roreri (strain MCA 2997) TaxID=1381753 RepID=V2XIE3_MONRO|nr:hypothetical protein Moror_1689 [Moniliophthora roreri MCA 2997]
MPLASTVSVASIQLPPDAIDHAYTEARKEGLFAGLTSALASAHIGSKFMGLRRYPTIACGVITGLAAGYLFTEAFKETHIRLLKQEATKAASNPEQGASTPISDKP